MPEYSEEDLRQIIFILIEKGYLERTEGEYPIVKWTTISRSVIRGEIKVMVRKKIKVKLGQRKKQFDLQYNRHLFEELSQLRKKFAEQAKVPAFVVFGDRSLMEMCHFYPRTNEEFLKINGVSSTKLAKYGKQFLQVIVHYCAKNNVLPVLRKGKNIITN
jgi:ATP-dependent DNA helicase RecQ